jgi:hypothetical protein
LPLFYTGIIAQSIRIDDSSRDASQLVQLLLGTVQRHQTFLFHLANQRPISTQFSISYKRSCNLRNGIAKYTEGKYTVTT